MMLRSCLGMLILFCSLISFGQNKSDYQWILGNGVERSLIIDFNDGFSQHYVDSPISLSLTIAQICAEESGELLFYTNGCAIIDSSFHVMEGGAMINNSELADYFCLLEGGYYPGFHSSIVLPHPSNSDQYYYLHKTVSFGDGNCNNLNYALIDLSLNDGKGAVIEKYQNIIQHDRLACGMVHAVRHANGHDLWSIQGRSDQGKYYKVLVDETGPHLHDVQDIGAPIKTVSGSQAIFSHDGSIYAVMDYISGLQLFDYDRETGELSNYQFVELPLNNIPAGICFSPNNRFLYVFFTSNVYQIDLWSNPPEPIFINTRDSTVGNPSSFYTNFAWGKLGPDCKIYVAPASGVDVLHVIHNPNGYGQACDFRHQDIPLIYPRSLGPPA